MRSRRVQGPGRPAKRVDAVGAIDEAAVPGSGAAINYGAAVPGLVNDGRNASNNPPQQPVHDEAESHGPRSVLAVLRLRSGSATARDSMPGVHDGSSNSAGRLRSLRRRDAIEHLDPITPTGPLTIRRSRDGKDVKERLAKKLAQQKDEEQQRPSKVPIVETKTATKPGNGAPAGAKQKIPATQSRQEREQSAEAQWLDRASAGWPAATAQEWLQVLLDLRIAGVERPIIDGFLVTKLANRQARRELIHRLVRASGAAAVARIMQHIKDQQFAVQVLENCQDSVPVGLQNDAVVQRVPELKKLGMTAPLIVSAAGVLGSATTALCARPALEVVQLLKLEQRAKLKVMLDANLAAGIGALVMAATPPLVDRLLLCASTAPAFSQLVACGSQPLTVLLQSLAYPNPLTLWCGALLSDTARLLSHHQWMAVSPAITVLASNSIKPAEIIDVLNAPTAGADFAAIVDALGRQANSWPSAPSSWRSPISRPPPGQRWPRIDSPRRSRSPRRRATARSRTAWEPRQPWTRRHYP